MKTNPRQQFADDLVCLISRTFHHAYFAHINGMSEVELLIDYDIEAAGLNIDKPIRNVCRRTIKSAIKAVDARVPYADAVPYLMQLLDTRIKQLVKPKRRQRRVATATATATPTTPVRPRRRREKNLEK